MQIKIAAKTPEIHTTPLHTILINEARSEIEFDDITESRWKMAFKTIQAWRITAADCFDTKYIRTDEAFSGGIYHRYILEVEDSPWISELKNILKKRAQDAHFLDKSHHYILVLGEDIVEVVAWDNFKLEQMVNQ